VDKSNGKMYVGSAYATLVFVKMGLPTSAQATGWNDELTKLISTNGIGYARENFQFQYLSFGQ